MVFVTGQALVDLGAAQVRKAAAHVIDARASDQEADYVMHANPGTFNDGFCLTDAGEVDQVAIGSCRHESQLTLFRVLSAKGMVVKGSVDAKGKPEGGRFRGSVVRKGASGSGSNDPRIGAIAAA